MKWVLELIQPLSLANGRNEDYHFGGHVEKKKYLELTISKSETHTNVRSQCIGVGYQAEELTEKLVQD